MNFIQKIVSKITNSKWALVPTTPTDDLLKTMAMRYDHAFFMVTTDEEVERLRKEFPTIGDQYLTSSERENILRKMKQLQTEVVGKGYYKL